MEDLLLQIVKEASGTKLSLLRKSAQEAHGMLYYHSRWKLSGWLQVHAKGTEMYILCTFLLRLLLLLMLFAVRSSHCKIWKCKIICPVAYCLKLRCYVHHEHNCADLIFWSPKIVLASQAYIVIKYRNTKTKLMIGPLY